MPPRFAETARHIGSFLTGLIVGPRRSAAAAEAWAMPVGGVGPGDSGAAGPRAGSPGMRRAFASDDLFSLALQSVGLAKVPFAANQLAWRHEMQRRCSLCPHRIRCRMHMELGDFAEYYPEFCPNGEDFAELRAARGLGPTVRKRAVPNPAPRQS